MSKNFPLTVRISPELLDQLKQAADEDDLSLAQIVRRATAEWLERRKEKRK